MRTFSLAGTGIMYYMVYAHDLHLIGYDWHSIFRVIALNLLLIPVNILGMVLSVAQAITGRKPRFNRTPKVQDRTRVPAGYIMAEFALLAIWCEHFVFSLIQARLISAVLMLLHIRFWLMRLGCSSVIATAVLILPPR